MSRYLQVRTAPALPGHVCQGRTCGRNLEPGEPFTLVGHERRTAAQPNAADARAWLCAGCCTGLGDRLLAPDEVPSAPPPPLPTHVRGQVLVPW